MKQIAINPNNRKYYSDEFIRGFECGTQRQLEADKADRPQDDDWEKYSDKLWKNAYERGKADRPQGEYTIEDVAEILSKLFCDECACNYNGIDEWLPFVCKYVETGDCPHPKDKHGCWMQYLIQGRARMKGADDETD